MTTDLQRAEQTAVNAADAMVRILDYAVSVLDELLRAVAKVSGLRLARSDAVRFSNRDPLVIRRYVEDAGPGASKVQRFAFGLFTVPFQLAKSTKSQAMPFMMISLVNREGRPPSLLYGLIKDREGRVRTEEQFGEYVLLKLNEDLDALREGSKRKKHGWTLRVDAPGRADTNRLKATVDFDEMPLFDTDESNLGERAEEVGRWLRERLGVAPG